MGSQDRDYYRSGGGSDYLGNPLSVFGYNLPVGTWFGVPISLNFWLLLLITFALVALVRGAPPIHVFITIGLTVGSLLAHEFGHRGTAALVGGAHDEFILWPLGGRTAPVTPPEPLAMFVANVGGIVASGLICLSVSIALVTMRALPSFAWSNPVSAVFGTAVTRADIAGFSLGTLYSFNLGLILINLFPIYFLDGGYLLQAILWPWTGLYRAINVTCIAGMGASALMILLGLYRFDLFNMIFWAFGFASSLNRRRQLQATGTNEFEDAIAYSARAGTEAPSLRRKLRWPARDAVKRAAKQAAADRREQEVIDAILAKVHDQGMHSLTWMEKRTLRKATERQRARGGAPRR